MDMESTGPATIASHRVCVVYDAKTGAILHVHEAITMGGGAAPREEDVVARALELAGQLSLSGRPARRAQMRTLFTGPRTFEEPGAKKVDLRRQQVVAAKKVPAAKKKRAR
jgi:hypothetical protein